jgi:hypothetical protein
VAAGPLGRRIFPGRAGGARGGSHIAGVMATSPWRRRSHRRQVLAPGSVPKESEKAVTTVLSAPYNIPLYELRWPIQFESKATAQTNDVIVLVDHWSLWERI